MNAVRVRRLFQTNTTKIRRPQNLRVYGRVRDAFDILADLFESNTPLDDIQGATEYLLDSVRTQRRSH